ncbi:MAG: hypothetical protein MZV64_52570 [Ignavibacteriales bacterium]|nr:hypothetical protein [Ignavibacteriales bacterium]
MVRHRAHVRGPQARNPHADDRGEGHVGGPGQRLDGGVHGEVGGRRRTAGLSLRRVRPACPGRAAALPGPP